LLVASYWVLLIIFEDRAYPDGGRRPRTRSRHPQAHKELVYKLFFNQQPSSDY